MEMNFLLIGKSSDTTWEVALQKALAPLGWLDAIFEDKALQQLQQKHYDVIIVDSVSTKDVVGLVSLLSQRHPLIPVVVVTASPTWQRARQVFLAGASDYLRKTLDADTLLTAFKAIVDRSR